MHHATKLIIGTLIEQDVVEPTACRARKLFEDQKELLAKPGGEYWNETNQTGVNSLAMALPVVAPTLLVAKALEGGQRLRQRIALGQKLRRARALVHELERFRAAATAPAAAPYRASQRPPVAGLSPAAAYLVGEAEVAALVRYWMEAPLPWRARTISGVAFAAGRGDDRWRLLFHAYTAHGERPIRQAMPTLTRLIGLANPVPCTEEAWRWHRGGLTPGPSS